MKNTDTESAIDTNGNLCKLDGCSYLLDTNVLLHDSHALEAFGDANIILTVDVLEELDTFKRNTDEKGRNARHVIRTIDELRRNGSLSEGVPLRGGGKLLILVQGYRQHLPNGLDQGNADNRILAAALHLKSLGREIIFVSLDINARVKGDALGIHCEDYLRSKINFDELYTGWREISVDPAMIDTFYKQNRISLDEEFLPNQGVLLRSNENPKHTGMGIFRIDSGEIETLQYSDSRPWGILPRNLLQHFALELLLRPDIQLVTMLGQAGTGKTLLALAVGLQMTAEERRYRKIMVSRPVIPLGRDIGYLPGSKEEKLSSWMEPIFDNLHFLVDPKLEQSGEKVEYLFENEIIEVEAVTYIRGRSLPNLFIIIDEAQNLTPHEVKTVISRAGENAKVILAGDAYQIDNPYLDAASNGLTYVVERFQHEPCYGHITLEKSERSELASLAASLL